MPPPWGRRSGRIGDSGRKPGGTTNEHVGMSTLLSRIVGACARHAWLVIGVAVVLCAGAFAYSATHIAMDTDSTKLISNDLPWRQREIVFDAAFPHRVDLIAVVIDAATPELAEEAAAAITQRLSAQTQ